VQAVMNEYVDVAHFGDQSRQPLPA
jgi:hypothetical protein